MPFGAAPLEGGGVRFRLWAPALGMVRLQLGDGPTARRIEMQPLPDGWHELDVPEAAAGTRYAFVMPDDLVVPDPASRFNPADVHGASCVVDPHAHAWTDASWRGRPWHEAVVYELHVGAFTPQGTFTAAMQRLPDLAALGITAIELMPIGDFPGRRGWGYDGVLLFAPDASYGSPADLKRFVEAAHALGMMVLLDVVYNHFGPEGNYLHAYAPAFFDSARHTPWGAAIDFDGPHASTVRDFYVHNALYWIEEYHLDGLRLDAVHAIRDTSPQHIICQIAHMLRDGPGRHRAVHVVLENDDNLAHLLGRNASGHPTCADAQWNDDFHHAAHALATGETDGYYADYADAPLQRLGRALAEGFVYQGEPSAFRSQRPRGEPSAQLPGTAFVNFLQNHDQIGNRAFGERMDALCAKPRLEALYACLLLSPHVPLLFMGEEFAASAPFLYFCDFGPDLAQAVSRGRRDEFKRFAAFRDEAARQRIPDPNAAPTFRACQLDWDERGRDAHASRLAHIAALLQLRRHWLTPRLTGQSQCGRHRVTRQVLDVAWRLGDASVWRLAFNAGDKPADIVIAGHRVYARGVQGAQLLPDGVLVTLEPPHD
jgi:maltooligosyltrehalose trehalohydrolase